MDLEIKKFVIPQKSTIKEAIKIVSKGGRGVALVLDKKEALLGIITDGDIRKGILEGVDLTGPVDRIINKNPKVLDKNKVKSSQTARDWLKKMRRRFVPIVDDDNVFVDLVFLKDFNGHYTKKSNKVVIMAGGEGTRLDPLTKILPKPLIPLGDKPIVEILMNKFKKFGFNNFIISLNYKADIIKMYFDNLKCPSKISYVNEAKLFSKRKLGTIGSLGLMKRKLKKTFFVINCDTIINTDYDDALKYHQKSENVLTLISSMQHIKIPFGILDIENGGKLKNIKEKPEYNFLVNTGMYIINPKVLKYIPTGKTMDMPELIKVLQDNKEQIGTFPISEDDWFDTGQWEEYQNTIKNMKTMFNL